MVLTGAEFIAKGPGDLGDFVPNLGVNDYFTRNQFLGLTSGWNLLPMNPDVEEALSVPPYVPRL